MNMMGNGLYIFFFNDIKGDKDICDELLSRTYPNIKINAITQILISSKHFTITQHQQLRFGVILYSLVGFHTSDVFVAIETIDVFMSFHL